MNEYRTIPREIPVEFAKWATGFGGIPSGNPEGKLWFCGIEYGGSDADRTIDYRIYPDSSSEYPYWTKDFKEKYGLGENNRKNEYTKWQFNQKQAKIACAYVSNGSLKGWREYLKDRFCTRDGETFGMNLYPMSFHNTDEELWGPKHFKETGFPSKTEYRVVRPTQIPVA